MIQYTILSLITASGLIFGAIIAKNSKEELSFGAKYIKTLMLTLTYLVLFLTAYALDLSIILIASIPTLMIMVLFYIPKDIRSYFVLGMLGLSYALAVKVQIDYLLLSLIFIALLCEGSMTYFYHNKRLYSSLAIKSVIFLAIPLIALLF